MHIALLLEDLLLGGTQTQALQLARGFIQSGHTASVWTLTSGDQLSSVASQNGIPVSKLGNQSVVTPLVLYRLARQVYKTKPDIVLLLTVLPNIWGRIVGKICFQPVIIGACRGGGAPFRQHEKFLWPLAKHIICNTQALRQVLTGQLGVPDKRISVIYNGIDTALFHPSEHKPRVPTVLHVGRLVPDKDQQTLLKAFSIVRNTVDTAQLRIVGDGPLRAQLENFAQELLPAHSYSFLPGTTNIAPMYRDAHVFAISSVREGLPNVLLEAMASGLPIVGTAVGGIPELITHQKNGFLVPPADHVRMAESLIALLTNTGQAQAFGQAGFQFIQKKFSASASLNAHLSLFDTILAH